MIVVAVRDRRGVTVGVVMGVGRIGRHVVGMGVVPVIVMAVRRRGGKTVVVMTMRGRGGMTVGVVPVIVMTMRGRGRMTVVVVPVIVMAVSRRGGMTVIVMSMRLGGGVVVVTMRGGGRMTMVVVAMRGRGGMAVIFSAVGVVTVGVSRRFGGVIVVTVARIVAVVVVRLVLVAHRDSVPQPLSAVFAAKSV